MNGIHYLNRMFIAHANISLENICVVVEACLSQARVLITSLTRPLVYYNVESDAIIQVKGLDHSSEPNMVEFYPPEAFSAQYIPSSLDLYSWAIVAAYLVKGKSPFTKGQLDSSRKLIQIKQDDSIVIDVPASLGGQNMEQLIATLTSPNIKVRPGTDDVLAHSFFNA